MGDARTVKPFRWAVRFTSLFESHPIGKVDCSRGGHILIQKFLFYIFWLPLVGFLLVLGAGSVGAQPEPDPFFLPGATDTEFQTKTALPACTVAF